MNLQAKLNWVLKPKQRKCLHQLCLEIGCTTEDLLPVLDELTQQGLVGTQTYHVETRPPVYITGFYQLKG